MAGRARRDDRDPVVDYAFPAYLSNISTIARFGTTIVFLLIVLGWFYVLAVIILGGAIVNALRLGRTVPVVPEGAIAAEAASVAPDAPPPADAEDEAVPEDPPAPRVPEDAPPPPVSTAKPGPPE